MLQNIRFPLPSTIPTGEAQRTHVPALVRRCLPVLSSGALLALVGCVAPALQDAESAESDTADPEPAADAACSELTDDTAAAFACAPSEPLPSLFPPGDPGIASSELTGAGAPFFKDIARLPEPPAADPYCSSSGYGRIDFCTNEHNPPAPSIVRRVGTARARDLTDRVSAYLSAGIDDHPDPLPAQAQGERVIQPPSRSSNDGRLHLTGEWETWPSLSYVRPEALTYDAVRTGTDDVVQHQKHTLHTFAFWNPMDTALPVVQDQNLKLQNRLNTLHSTLCEASSADHDPQELPRNPIPCSAHYGDFPYDDHGPSPEQMEVKHGLCYRVSFLGSVDLVGGSDPRRELRSNALTVFVPSVYDPASDEDLWIYPDDPESVFDTPPLSGEVALPDFAPYDLNEIFRWNREEDPITLVTSTNLQLGHAQPWDEACYVSQNGAFVENPVAPPFCDFLFQQHRTSTFYFDSDLDAIAERFDPADPVASAADLTVWNGNNDYFIFEPVTTGDGKVLFINNNAGLYYSKASQACRADELHSYVPYSVMPNDPAMLAAGYELALSTGGQPFRDPAGEEIPFGSIQRFAYQWVDRAGTNLFFATVNQQRDEYIADPSRITRLPVDASLGTPPLVPVPDEHGNIQATDTDALVSGFNTRAGHQVGVLGGWTSGRMVILDNGLNASDLGGSRGYAYDMSSADPDSDPPVHFDVEYELPLYSDATVELMPHGVSLLGSMENRFNHLDALRPTLPFDVVWTVSANNQTMSEVVFDDYMDRRAFAVVHMNPSVRLYHDEVYRSRDGGSLAAVENGFMPGSFGPEEEHGPWKDDPDYMFNIDDSRDGEPGARPVLQNAAPFSTINRVRLRGGARIEPVGLGGVLGRGVFLDGVNDFMDMGYQLPSDQSWFLGLWIEPHPVPVGTIEEVFHFADGSFVGLKATASGYNLITRRANGAINQVALGSLIQDRRYVHLGVRSVKPAGNQIERTVFFYVDGTRVAALNVPAGTGEAGLHPAVGCEGQGCWTWMTVGAPWLGTAGAATTRSFRGWVDELRIYRLRPEDVTTNAGFEEQVCNFALGTLANPEGPSVPQSIVDLREHIRQQTTTPSGSTNPVAVCEQLVLETIDEPFDLPRQHRRTWCASRVHAASTPEYCLRSSRLSLPTLVADDPRPSSASTPFCLSCHTDAAHIDGLKLRALETHQQNPSIPLLPRFEDPRRQPLNPPAVMALPQHDCVTPQLDDTWYARFLDDGSIEIDDGQWTTDHLFDHPSVEGYLPPRG